MTDDARRVACEALVRIDQDDAYANIVVPAMLERSKLDPRDRRFVTELVYGTTRMRRPLDAEIAPHLQREIDTEVRAALRLGAYQLHYAGVPAHAAVSATVAAAPKRAQGFVNAVLRRVAEAGPRSFANPADRLSYPDWIVEQLRSDLGDADAFGALEAMNAPPRPHARDDGYIQDPASGWVAGLVDVKLGHRVADVCAAPGGKATAMAHVIGDGLVVAADIRPHRVALIKDNAQRTGTAAAVAPLIADAAMPPLRSRAFDRVLIDAPCSGLGVLHRRPDARWRVHPDVPPVLAEQSQAMLRGGAELVAHDGVLVFSVCTLNATETADVAGWAAHELHGFTPMPSPGGPWRPHGHGALLLPQVAGTDGMFIARFHRS